MWRWWPWRSRDERHDDIGHGLSELAVSFGIILLGLLILLAGAYFDEGALIAIGVTVAALGAYAVGQSLVGLLVDVTIGWRGAFLVLCGVIVGFLLWQGYTLLME